MKEVKRSHSGLGNRHYSESKHDTETRLNKTSHPREFNKTQGYVIGILCLLILSIGLGAWALSLSNGLFHSTSTYDPYTAIWEPSNSSSVFQHDEFSGQLSRYNMKNGCSSQTSCEYHQKTNTTY